MPNLKLLALRYTKECFVHTAMLFTILFVNSIQAEVYLEQNYDWEKPPKPHKTPEEFLKEAKRITLKDSIYNVLERTIAGQNVKLDWLSTQIDFEQSRRAFYIPDMKITSGLNFSYGLDGRPDATLANPGDDTLSIAPSAGFSASHTLLNGASLAFSTTYSGSHSKGGKANDSNTASYAFNVSYPLLKGNLGRFLDVKNVYLGFEKSYWNHIQSISGIITGASRDYWTLVGAIKKLQIQQDQTLRTAETIKSTKDSIADGSAIPDALNDAIIALAKQRISLTQAEQAVYDAYMNFINGQGEVNLCTDFEWDLILDDYYTTEDIDIHEYQSQMWNFVIESLDRRIDIQNALIAEEQAEMSLIQAYNSYLPNLDVNGSISNTGGRKGTKARPFFSSADLPSDLETTTNLSAGISFSMPLLDFSTRTSIIKSKISLKQARMSRQQVVQNAIRDLKIITTDILSLLRQLKQQKFIISDTRDILTNKIFLLKQGMLTIQEYLGYQGQYTSVLLQQNTNYVALAALFVRLRDATNTLIYTEDDCTIHIADIYTLPFGSKKTVVKIEE